MFHQKKYEKNYVLIVIVPFSSLYSSKKLKICCHSRGLLCAYANDGTLCFGFKIIYFSRAKVSYN